MKPITTKSKINGIEIYNGYLGFYKVDIPFFVVETGFEKPSKRSYRNENNNNYENKIVKNNQKNENPLFNNNDSEVFDKPKSVEYITKLKNIKKYKYEENDSEEVFFIYEGSDFSDLKNFISRKYQLSPGTISKSSDNIKTWLENLFNLNSFDFKTDFLAKFYENNKFKFYLKIFYDENRDNPYFQFNQLYNIFITFLESTSSYYYLFSNVDDNVVNTNYDTKYTNAIIRSTILYFFYYPSLFNNVIITENDIKKIQGWIFNFNETNKDVGFEVLAAIPTISQPQKTSFFPIGRTESQPIKMVYNRIETHIESIFSKILTVKRYKKKFQKPANDAEKYKKLYNSLNKKIPIFPIKEDESNIDYLLVLMEKVEINNFYELYLFCFFVIPCICVVFNTFKLTEPDVNQNEVKEKENNVVENETETENTLIKEFITSLNTERESHIVFEKTDVDLNVENSNISNTKFLFFLNNEGFKKMWTYLLDMKDKKDKKETFNMIIKKVKSFADYLDNKLLNKYNK